LDLLGLWDGVDLAIVADAARSGADPGTILLTDLGGGDAPSGQAAHASATSTHGIGLVGVLRLARVVGQAPKRVVAVSVEGADFAQGSGFSPGVAEALDAAASRAVEMIEEIRRRS
jgi:hydrogenase maturation protease